MDAGLWLAATVTPGKDNLDPTTVSPGLGGFLVTFGLAIALVLLVRSMVGHLRKVRYSTPPDVDETPQGRGATKVPPRPDDV